MPKKIPITIAQKEFASLPAQAAQESEPIALTRRGKPVIAVMTWERYQIMMKALRILGARHRRLMKKEREARTKQLKHSPTQR